MCTIDPTRGWTAVRTRTNDPTSNKMIVVHIRTAQREDEQSVVRVRRSQREDEHSTVQVQRLNRQYLIVNSNKLRIYFNY